MSTAFFTPCQGFGRRIRLEKPSVEFNMLYTTNNIGILHLITSKGKR